MCRNDFLVPSGWALWVCWLMLGLSQIGCGEPVPPGSDMPAEAPPAVLGAEPTAPEMMRDPPPLAQPDPGVRLDGQFDVFGDLSAGVARVDLEIVSDNEESSARFESPSPVSVSGQFSGRVVDYLVPHEFSDLLTEDVYTDLYFEASIMTQDCFYGGLGLQLKNARIADVPTPVSLRLDGRFVAVRTGTDCDFTAPENDGGVDEETEE